MLKSSYPRRVIESDSLVRLVIPFKAEPCSTWQKQELSFLFRLSFSLSCSLIGTQHNLNPIVPGRPSVIPPSVLVKPSPISQCFQLTLIRT